MRRGILLALLAGLASTPAWAQSCEELYFRRNAIYKEAGFCFKTPRAIRTFGNAGCQFDDMRDVPLSPRQRRVVENLQAREYELGCR